MNLKPELLSTLTNLGVSEEELVLLRDRMLSSVTSIQAQITALDGQISTLQGQKVEAEGRLAQAQVTLSKLLDEATL